MSNSEEVDRQAELYAELYIEWRTALITKRINLASEDFYVIHHVYLNPTAYCQETHTEGLGLGMAKGVVLFHWFYFLMLAIFYPASFESNTLKICGNNVWLMLTGFFLAECACWIILGDFFYALIAPQDHRKSVWLKYGITCPKCFNLAEPKSDSGNKYRCHNCNLESFSGAPHNRKTFREVIGL